MVLQPRAQQLTNPGQQTLVGAERFGLDQKSAGNS